MKLASFVRNGEERIGAALGETALIDLQSHWPADRRAPGSMIELIELGQEGLRLASAVLAQARDAELIDTTAVDWLPPVVRPAKICGIAMNNSASNARKIAAPDHPAFFIKPSSCLAAHQQPLVMRTYYGSMHPEPELAVIIGRTTRDVDAVDALAHVYGYSIFNDITGNHMRSEDMFHYYALYGSKDNPDQLERREQHLSYAGRYKGADNFGVLGPWLVTADEVDNPDDLEVSCSVAGEVVAEDSTRYYNYKVAELISFISQFHTLHPGDIISCGTAFKPSETRKSIHHANFLVTGGPVEITIEKLGTQHNPVLIEKREIGTWKLT
ncbi:MAG: fumarylacetoacetate hydrolase family protein [Desulfofustis sp.]|jgi:2,4-diketo-3-deoxy-L-fuconate hydrolase